MGCPSLLFSYLAIAAALLYCGGCMVGPDYKKPESPIPLAWNWKTPEPKDDLPKGPWWKIFQDPVLCTLEEKATEANPTLKIVVAQVDAARASVWSAQGALLPGVNAQYQYTHFKTSANQPGSRALPSITGNLHAPTVGLTYEVDLWGQIRRGLESAEANLDSNLAAYQNALLTLQAQVASQYFLLRIADAESKLLEKAVEILAKNLTLVQTQKKAGLNDSLAEAQAETILQSTTASLTEKRRQRFAAQNTLALLCGETASTFNVEEAPIIARPIEIPAGLPSTLLERRPDVASAERALQAASAQIGVAYANLFPNISLTGQYGYASGSTHTLFSPSSNLWSYGPTVTLPLFQGGRLWANMKSAEAAYHGAQANYQATVIQAFTDVENALKDVYYYKETIQALKKAVGAAQTSAKLSQMLYSRGLVNYLQVIDSERTAIITDISTLDVLALRFLASVQLIKALGGGWNVTDLRDEAVPTLF